MANSPYQLTDTVVIAQGVTLTIDPGVEVQFDTRVSLIVDGAIVADGAAGSEITFTSSANSPAKGDWGTIRFNNTTGVGSVFDHVIVEYGGAPNSEGNTGAMISYRTGAYAFDLTNVTVRNSGGHGIDLRASTPLIDESEFIDNNGYGVFSDLGLSYAIDNSVFTGNSIGGIRVPINSTPSIQNSTISTNGVGIYIDNGAVPTIKDNTLDANTVGIVVIEAANQSPVITDNTIQNSTNIGLENRGNGEVTAEYNFWGHKSGPTNFLNPTGTGDKVSTNVDFNPWLYGATLPVVEITTNPVNGDVWSANTVYWVKKSITLNVGQTLSIEPGAVIKFADNVDFNINGTLIADGTAEDKIFFTSQYDDAIGGDSNGDERTTQPAKGNWRRVLVNESSQDNVFDYVDMRYGGYSGEMFYVIDASTSITNSYFTDSNVSGISVYRSLEDFRNITANNNRYTGIVIVAPDSELRNLTAMYNGDHGLYIDQRYLSNTVQIVGGIFNYNENHGIWSRYTDSDYRSIDSLVGVTASYNGETGVVIEGSNVSEILVKDNVFSHNSNYGASFDFLTRLRDKAVIRNNTFEQNGLAGLRTSSAQIFSNEFTGNEYGISLFGHLGHIYHDGAGNDNNTFTDNTFNNVLGLEGISLKDTLSATFPEEISSGAYMFHSYFYSKAVSANDTLVIEPGVIIKMGYKHGDGFSGSYMDFNVENGLLIAKGTAEKPIIFTSWRDESAGGDTDAADDTVSAKRYDWDALSLYLSNKDNHNTEESVLEHVELRYGGDALYLSMNNATFTHSISNVKVHNAYNTGILLDYGRYTIADSEVINSERYDGIQARVGNTDLTVRNSVIRGNGRYGIHGYGPSYGSFIREVSNSVIENNGADGIYNTDSPSPATIQNNKVRGNGQAGMYFNIKREVDTDTVLTISGNLFENNAGPGFISSRAIVVDDTLRGNQFPFGMTGQISKKGTVNELGNYYEGNVIEAYTYDSLITIEGTIFGVLGGNVPSSYSNKLYVNRSEDYYGNNIVPAGDSLTIKPGTIVKYIKKGLSVDGTLLVEGTETGKVVFTSFLDDTYAGNTNNDTTGVQPGRNNWGGIYLNGQPTDSSRISNLIVRYADNGLEMRDTEAVVDSSIFSFNSSGVYVHASAKPTFRYSDFHSNGTGLNVASSAQPLVQLSNFYNNSDQGLYQGAGTQITAINNYWGDPSGPFVDNGPDQNVNGQGDRINVSSGTVDYRPYLVGRNGILLGDVTINGTISAFDASKILLHVVGLDILTGNNLAAGDVTGNGTVSSMDASLVLQYVVGIISGFPGQGKIVVPEPQNMLSLGYEDGVGYTDIKYDHKGGFNFYGTEMDLIVPTGSVERVELANSAYTENLQLSFNQIGDTLRIAMASALPIKQAGSIGSIRLIHTENNDIENLSEQFTYRAFSSNEIDLTEFVNDNFTTEGIESLIPEEFMLNQNYPNPFNPSTNITYQLPANGTVKVQVFNMLGQLVQTLVDDNQKAGVYNLRWDASTFSSGTYLLRIDVVGEENQNYSQIRKMLLIK